MPTSNHTEADRLKKLYSLEILDTAYETEFDQLTQLAAQIARTPISLITLLDADRQWFKAKTGMEDSETERGFAVCNYTIQQDELFEVEDLAGDKRFTENPYVTKKPKFRYYAGMPLITSDGYRLGALCVLDTRTRTSLNEEQANALTILSRQAARLIEARAKARELRRVNEILNRIADTTSRSLSPAVQLLEGLTAKNDTSPEVRRLSDHVLRTEKILQGISKWRSLDDNMQASHSLLHSEVNEVFREIQKEAGALEVILKNETGGTALIHTDQPALRFVLRSLIQGMVHHCNTCTITVKHFSGAGKGHGITRDYISIQENGKGYASFLRNALAAEPDMHTDDTGYGLLLLLAKDTLAKMGGSITCDYLASGGTHVMIVL